MTAWAEPTGAMAVASLAHRTLSFILAGVEVSNAGFTSQFIHRGRIRSWEMPERAWEKHAAMETEDDGDEYLAGYQPRIMQALIDHWEPAVRARLKLASRRARPA